jgi:hypothetical protein
MSAARLTVADSGAVGKPGNAPEECEDVFEVFSGTGGGARVALSDGATECSYAGVWARILAGAFDAFDVFSDDIGAETRRWFERCQREWTSWERQLLERPLQWFARAKLTHGAAATFLGFAASAESGAEVRFRAVACGDTCLFLVRRDGGGARLAMTFPIHAGDEFTMMPPLLSTAMQPERVSTCMLLGSGSLSTGDAIYMATDALAQWVFSELAGGRQPWAALDAVATDADLESLVAAELAAGRIREDDVALVRIEYDDAGGQK